MKKQQLIEKLKLIKDQYIDAEPLCVEQKTNVIKEFADCLDHPQIEQYLLATGIVSTQDKLQEALPLYQSAENIIEAFTESYYMLEDMGLVRLKNPAECWI